MNRLLFDPEFVAANYNCSGRSYQEWRDLGHPNQALGLTYAFLSAVYLTILLPFMYVFFKTDLIKYSCYKIMFYIGVVDCIALVNCGVYAGYGAYVGMVFCMHPQLNYLLGCSTIMLWTSGSSSCMLLGINRCIDLINSNLGKWLFDGKKTILWLFVPTAVAFYFAFFTPTIPFNSNVYAFIYDPFVGTPERNGTLDSVHYPPFALATYNIVVVVVLLAAYSSLLIHLSIQAARSGNRVNISRYQKQTFMQSTLVCMGTFIAALVYVYMNIFPIPVWVAVFGELGYQASHGAAGLSYAFLNPTMRRELAKNCCAPRVHPRSTSTLHVKASTPAETSDLEY